MQRIVERSQIRINLLRQGAGQETQPLTSLNSWPSKDDAIHPLGLQCLDRFRDRQISFAGTSGADTKDNRVVINSIYVALLV